MKCIYKNSCELFSKDCEDFEDCKTYRSRANADLQIRLLRERESKILGIGACTEPVPREEFKTHLWDRREI